MLIGSTWWLELLGIGGYTWFELVVISYLSWWFELVRICGYNLFDLDLVVIIG